jgi:mutual gliding-motility protein MglA
MPTVNQQARELVFKIVYYGPGLSGKTTSLQYIHETARPEHRGKLISLATPVDRTLYFDFLPIRLPTARDLGVRLQLFTVPGQVHYNATRKLVLTGVDGIVFVADSRHARLESNTESLRNLEENLAEQGRSLAETPHVLMYNKRDLSELTDIEQLDQVINTEAAPSFAAVASAGEGVYEALEAITRAVIEDFERRMPEHHDMFASSFLVPEGGLMEALRGVDDGSEPGVVSAREPNPPEALGVTAVGTVVSDGSFDGEEPNSIVNLSRARSSLGIDIAFSGFGSQVGDDGVQPTRDVVRPVPQGLRASRESAGISLDPELLRGGRSGGRSDASLRASHAVEASSRSSLPGESALGEHLDRTTTRSKQPPFSLCALFRDTDVALVGTVEAAIATGDTVEAVRLCDELVERSLAQAIVATGQEGSSPAEMALLLGVDRALWLECRAIVRRVKSQGAIPMLREALACLLLCACVQQGRSRIVG